MSVTPTFFNIFSQNLGRGVHNLHTDNIRFMLANAAPAATDTAVDTTAGTCTMVGSGAAEIAAGNGYTKKGFLATGQSYTQTAGLSKLAIAAQPNWTSNTGNMGPFQYVIAFDDTAGTTSTRPPICWWVRPAAVTLDGTQGDTFTHNIDITDVLQNQ